MCLASYSQWELGRGCWGAGGLVAAGHKNVPNRYNRSVQVSALMEMFTRSVHAPRASRERAQVREGPRAASDVMQRGRRELLSEALAND